MRDRATGSATAGNACTSGCTWEAPTRTRESPAVRRASTARFSTRSWLPAIVAGRGTFEPANGWGGDHHDGVPIWILSRREPGIDVSQWPLVTYTNDVKSAMTEAKRAAGEKNVLVHGAATAQLALAAGLLDELEIHLIPVLLGQGRRMFDNLSPQHIELQRTRIIEGEDGVTHTHYRVAR
jgi:dihydrofolate reductase